MMRFTILTPDAQYPDDALVERQVAGKDVEFLIHRTRDPAAIPLEHWAACDAFLVWHEMKIDHTLIDKAKKRRVIVRAGVGYNQINLEDAAAGEFRFVTHPIMVLAKWPITPSRSCFR